MFREFNVGDTVFINKPETLIHNDTATILRTDGKRTAPYQARIDRTGDAWWFAGSELSQERVPLPETKPAPVPAQPIEQPVSQPSSAAIADVRRWTGSSGEVRVYVHMTDGREGVRYVTGNPRQPKGTVDGKLTDAEWAEAQRQALRDGRWQTYYAPQPQTTQQTVKPAVRTNRRADRCTICDTLVHPGQGRLEHYDQDYLDDMDIFDITPGWHVFCLDEAGCRQRVQQARLAAQEARERAAAFDAHKRCIRDAVQSRGERPEQTQYPAGERVLDTRNIYGSGDCFIIADDGSLWYIQSNGMDGDDWSRNNLAGAIGWRLADAGELIAELRHLEQERENAKRQN